MTAVLADDPALALDLGAHDSDQDQGADESTATGVIARWPAWLQHGARMMLQVGGFWMIVLLLLSQVVVLYIVPSQQRLDTQREALDDARIWFNGVQTENERLTAEAESLNDPYYVERLLREEYHWQPTNRLDRNGRIIAD